MFKFKLEFLLRFRRQKEETAMYELAQKIREANRIESEIMDMSDRASVLAEEALKIGETGVPAPVYGLYMDYRDHLRKKQSEAKRQLFRAEAIVEKQRKALVKASVDRKIIETFKDRQREMFNKEQARKEQQNVEELASLAESRKRHEQEED